MKKSAALLAVAGMAAVAHAQTVSILLNNNNGTNFQGTGGVSSVVFPSLTAVSTVQVDVVLSWGTAGAPTNFKAWAAYIGTMTATHSSGVAAGGDMTIAAEASSHVAEGPGGFVSGGFTPENWPGGRRPAEGGFGGPPTFPFIPAGNSGNDGGFRFPGGPAYSVAGGGTPVLTLSDGGANINASQSSVALGNTNQNNSTDISVFRFSMTPSIFGTYTLDAVFADLAYYLPDGTSNIPGLQASATFNSATITVLPAPSTLALLGLGGIAAVRRRR